MSIKEKMADKWMENMSSEEKEKMMSSMMDKFFAGMSPDEKKKMMEHMMKKFMSGPDSGETAGMMGGAPFMMGMMKMMKGRHMKGMMSGPEDCCGEGDEGSGKGEEAGPMDMCRRMMATIGRTADLAVYATPEVRGLFEEWAAQIEDEILQFVKESQVTDADQIAVRFKISKESAKYFLGRLSQKGKVTLKAEGSKSA